MSERLLPSRPSLLHEDDWFKLRPPVRDVLIAGLTGLVDVLLFSDVLSGQPAPAGSLSTPDSVVFAGALISIVVLSWRRRFPIAALVGMCVSSVVFSLFTTYRPVVTVCAAAATATARSGARRALLAGGICAVTSAAWVVNEERTSPEHLTWQSVTLIWAGYLVLLAISAGIGRWQRAHRLHGRELERRRAEAVRAERARMAMELHDIVAHAVTLIVVQAGGGRKILTSDPGRAAVALETIEELGAQAIEELRRLLAVMDSVDDSVDFPPSTASVPSLASAQDLFTAARGVGMNVSTETHGRAVRLDPSVSLAAYRIVQEGLTNATKHAGPGAHVLVRFDWGEDLVKVTIKDDGGGTTVPAAQLSTGYGLLGLTERVFVLNGAISAEHTGDRGFVLTATLPYRGSAS